MLVSMSTDMVYDIRTEAVSVARVLETVPGGMTCCITSVLYPLLKGRLYLGCALR